MPYYKFKGFKLDGKRTSGEILANDPNDLKVILKNENIVLDSYVVMKEKRTSNFFAVSSKVKAIDFLNFCQEFSIMLKAGVSITDCLNTLRKQPFGTIFRNTISDVYEDVLKGVYLSDAFRKHPKAFPDFFCSMVYVGELSGNLSEVLMRTAAYYEQDNKTKRKTRTAMIYPTFLSILIVVIVIALMTFVVPQFTDMITELGQEVPLLTRIVMNISNFFVDNILIIVVGLIVVILGLWLFLKKTRTGKVVQAWINFHMPIIKKVSRASLTARFSSSFGILLSSGMSVVDAMEGLIPIMGNELFSRKFRFAVEEVKRGKRISRAIENTSLFPTMLIQMIAIGEDNGSLEDVLNSVSDYFTDQVNIAVSRATAVLEPLIIVVLGIVVGIVILSVLMAMTSMMTSISTLG